MMRLSPFSPMPMAYPRKPMTVAFRGEVHYHDGVPCTGHHEPHKHKHTEPKKGFFGWLKAIPGRIAEWFQEFFSNLMNLFKKDEAKSPAK